MGWRGTLILAVLIVAVGTYLWLAEPPPQAPRRPQVTLLGEPITRDPNAPVRHLLEFVPTEVVAVELERGGQRYEVKRTDGSWRPAAPVVSDLLNDLAELGVLMEIETTPAELKDYGLHPPRSVLTLRLRGRHQPLVLQLGDRNPSVTGVYARLGEKGPVVLAGALVAWEFEKAFNALAEAKEG